MIITTKMYSQKVNNHTRFPRKDPDIFPTVVIAFIEALLLQFHQMSKLALRVFFKLNINKNFMSYNIYRTLCHTLQLV
jgi:hypothetical protein